MPDTVVNKPSEKELTILGEQWRSLNSQHRKVLFDYELTRNEIRKQALSKRLLELERQLKYIEDKLTLGHSKSQVGNYKGQL